MENLENLQEAQERLQQAQDEIQRRINEIQNNQNHSVEQILANLNISTTQVENGAKGSSPSGK